MRLLSNPIRAGRSFLCRLVGSIAALVGSIAALVGSIAGLVVAAGIAQAHPLADIRYDRTIAVRLGVDGVEVTYTLDVSPLGMHIDAAQRLTPAEVAALDRTLRGYAAAYARKVAVELQEQLRLHLDGQRLPLRLVSTEVVLTDHPTCRYVLRAAWPDSPHETLGRGQEQGPEQGQGHQHGQGQSPGAMHPAARQSRLLQVEDRTFVNYPGVLNLTVDVRGAVEVVDLEEPPLRVRSRPLEQLEAAEAAMARQARIEFLWPRPATPPRPEPAAPESPQVQLPQPVVSTEAAEVQIEEPSRGLLADLAERGLAALFDSSAGTGLALLLAFGFGAAHAFTPGHGKTLAAAYLIGERGTVRHAVLLALTTTAAHTGSVMVVALVLWWVYGTRVPVAAHGVLQLVAGLLVTGVGVWLLSRRLTGRADHFHLFGGHHHHHHHGHAHHHGHSHSHSHHRHHHHPHRHNHAHTHSRPHHDHDHAHPDHHHHHGDHNHHHHDQHGNDCASPDASAAGTFGWLRLVLMGLGGGLVPCWDAVLLLVAAAAIGRLDWALPLLVAFSLGLATVLVLVGVSVVYAMRLGQRRFRESRSFHLLPTLSALLLVGLGLWLCQGGLALLGGKLG